FLLQERPRLLNRQPRRIGKCSHPIERGDFDLRRDTASFMLFHSHPSEGLPSACSLVRYSQLTFDRFPIIELREPWQKHGLLELKYYASSQTTFLGVFPLHNLPKLFCPGYIGGTHCSNAAPERPFRSLHHSGH